MGYDIHGYFGKVYFAVHLATNKCLLEGDSSTGKTYFYKACDEAWKKDKNIYTATYGCEEEDLAAHICGDSNRLFVLDRTDIWLTDKLCWLIMNNPQNYYIVIGRFIDDILWDRKEIITLKSKRNIIYSSNLDIKEVTDWMQEDDNAF